MPPHSQMLIYMHGSCSPTGATCHAAVAAVASIVTICVHA